MNDLIYAGRQWSKKSSTRSVGSKIKITIIAFVLGIFFGAIIISALGFNPFSVYGDLLTFNFKTSKKINTLLIYTAIYSISGIANAFAFKAGLFNIGVPGQMIAGGGTAIALGLTVFKGLPSGVLIPLLLVISFLVAGLVGLFVGFLKSQFNVHEVVSTILLNWIIFYLFKYMFRPAQNFISQTADSKYLNKDYWLGGTDSNAWITSIIIVIVLALVVFFIFKFTTFGRKLKMTGLNRDGAQYAGINIKRSIMASIAISAAIGGLLGFVYYFGKQHFFEKLDTTLPTYGFDGIAIALLAFNSPLIIPVISFLYALFQNGAGGTQIPSGIQYETISLIFSIIIYFAAISALFINFRPIRFLKMQIKLRTNQKSKLILSEAEKLINLITKKENKDLVDIKNNIDRIRMELNNYKESKKNKQEIHKLNKDLKLAKDDFKDQNRLMNQRIKSIKHESLIRAIENIDKSIYDKDILNYKMTIFYVLNKLKNNWVLEKNNYILNSISEENYSKEKIKIHLNDLKQKYINRKKEIRLIQIELKQKLKNKEIKKEIYLKEIQKHIMKGAKKW